MNSLKKLINAFVLVFLFVSTSCKYKNMNTSINTINTIAYKQAETQTEALAEKNAKKKNYPLLIQNKYIFNNISPKGLYEVRIELDLDKLEFENAVIKNSRIHLVIDYFSFKIAWATKEQIEYLKSNHIQVYGKWEWVPNKAESRDKNKIYSPDIYLDYWKERKKETWFLPLSRIYKDLNSDRIPEILISFACGSGGCQYKVYQITKKGYLSLGSISYMSIQTLPSQHNGMNDLMLYWHMSADDGDLSVVEYNGFTYECVKSMPVLPDQAIQAKIFIPDHTRVEEQGHPDSDYLQWSSKDDDKYRKMIK